MKIPKESLQQASDAEKKLVKNISAVLDQQAQELPAHIQVRLNVARSEAINQRVDNHSNPKSTNSRSNFFGIFTRPYWSAGALGFAAMFAVAVTVVFDSPKTDGPSPLVDELNLVVANKDFSLLQEDLEFYVWLQEQDANSLEDSSKNSG